MRHAINSYFRTHCLSFTFVYSYKILFIFLLLSVFLYIHSLCVFVSVKLSFYLSCLSECTMTLIYMYLRLFSLLFCILFLLSIYVTPVKRKVICQIRHQLLISLSLKVEKLKQPHPDDFLTLSHMIIKVNWWQEIITKNCRKRQQLFCSTA